YVIPTSDASTHTRFCQLRTDYFHPVAQPVGRAVEAAAAPLGGQAGDGVADAAAPAVGAVRAPGGALVAHHPPRAHPRAAPAGALDRALLQQLGEGGGL